MTTTTSPSSNTGNDFSLTNQHIYTPRNFYRYLGPMLAVITFVEC